jgi:tetratricopeptide (TPR) repeat protein
MCLLLCACARAQTTDNIETGAPSSLIRLGLADFNRALQLCPDTVQFLQWRAWARWLMRDYEICAADCDRGLEFAPRSVPLLRLRGDVLVELRLYRRALADYDAIVQLYTESGDVDPNLQVRADTHARAWWGAGNGERGSDALTSACDVCGQDLLRRKHEVANLFLQQADELTDSLLAHIEGKEGSKPESVSEPGRAIGPLLVFCWGNT